MSAPLLTWKAIEHAHTPSSDWYWALGIVAVSGAITAILLHNILFAVLILIGSLTLGMYANKPEYEVEYSISTRGITVNKTLYPYKSIVGFAIVESKNKSTLLLDAQQPFVPHVVVPIPDGVDKNAVQDFLLDYLPEVELYESPAQKLFEILGF